MLVEVMDDPAGDVLEDLRVWLRGDAPGLRVERVRGAIGPGEMSGGVVAALETAVLSKELLGMLVTGVAGWLSARATTRRTKIRVKLGEVEVEIDTADVAKADEIARRLGRELGGS
ncbi:hypothetical protein [Dactylosporangium sp. NPDC049140]|uniref:effector-associated constant component EACC1 n=1 Tax=Dactylosporangium sp. NPDC049140 TaxID=3155647 RepID=UPI0033D8C44E